MVTFAAPLRFLPFYFFTALVAEGKRIYVAFAGNLGKFVPGRVVVDPIPVGCRCSRGFYRFSVGVALTVVKAYSRIFCCHNWYILRAGVGFMGMGILFVLGYVSFF